MTPQEKQSEAFYARLKEQLENDTTWPSPYLFKFIVPANLEKIAVGDKVMVTYTTALAITVTEK